MAAVTATVIIIRVHAAIEIRVSTNFLFTTFGDVSHPPLSDQGRSSLVYTP